MFPLFHERIPVMRKLWSMVPLNSGSANHEPFLTYRREDHRSPCSPPELAEVQQTSLTLGGERIFPRDRACFFPPSPHRWELAVARAENVAPCLIPPFSEKGLAAGLILYLALLFPSSEGPFHSLVARSSDFPLPNPQCLSLSIR